MNKTKIEWCDTTWNPVTGCLYGCEYCYARKIANRFKSRKNEWSYTDFGVTCYWNNIKMPILNNPVMFHDEGGVETGVNPYPLGFNPTFHEYRLGEPSKKIKEQNIFVCSMSDLFGNWVPDEWIKKVFEACEDVPQHRYMFLTKNPDRYNLLSSHCKLPYHDNFFYGTTINTQRQINARVGEPFGCKRFLSIEPIMESINSAVIMDYDWIIIGAETGNRKNKIVPDRKWIENIVNFCIKWNVPVFMKDSLINIMGEENMLREFPEGLKK